MSLLEKVKYNIKKTTKDQVESNGDKSPQKCGCPHK
jgi:hypothetical protein